MANMHFCLFGDTFLVLQTDVTRSKGMQPFYVNRRQALPFDFVFAPHFHLGSKSWLLVQSLRYISYKISRVLGMCPIFRDNMKFFNTIVHPITYALHTLLPTGGILSAGVLPLLIIRFDR